MSETKRKGISVSSETTINVYTKFLSSQISSYYFTLVVQSAYQGIHSSPPVNNRYSIGLKKRGAAGGGGRNLLTEITRNPLAAKPMICLKYMSAVPLTGGKHTSGDLTVFGPESYTFQPWKKNE